MISPERTGTPTSLARSLPEEIALRVARAVEMNRFGDAKSLPHEMMPKRTALRRPIGADRTPSPLRSFCMPFEDVLCDIPRRTLKQKGRISRDSVAPIWTWVSQFLLPQETKIYCRNFKSAVAAARHDDSKAYAASFWALAADAMRSALADGTERERARRILNSELVLADAEEAALLLGVAPAIVAIQETLARQTPALTDEHLRVLRTIHDGLIQSAPNAASYVAVIAMNRLAHPWEALKLACGPEDMSRTWRTLFDPSDPESGV